MPMHCNQTASAGQYPGMGWRARGGGWGAVPPTLWVSRVRADVGQDQGATQYAKPPLEVHSRVLAVLMHAQDTGVGVAGGGVDRTSTHKRCEHRLGWLSGTGRAITHAHATAGGRGLDRSSDRDTGHNRWEVETYHKYPWCTGANACMYADCSSMEHGEITHTYHRRKQVWD